MADPPPALPNRALAWVEAVAQHAVADVRSVGGGITKTKWLLRLTSGESLVIRWSDPRVWGEVGREHVRREALACRLFADSELPVPRLIGSDPDGLSAGGPANLMTWRPGRVRLDRLEPAAIAELAKLAVDVHRRLVPADHRPPVFAFRGPAEPAVPGWAR